MPASGPSTSVCNNGGAGTYYVTVGSTYKQLVVSNNAISTLAVSILTNIPSGIYALMYSFKAVVYNTNITTLVKTSSSSCSGKTPSAVCSSITLINAVVVNSYYYGGYAPANMTSGALRWFADNIIISANSSFLTTASSAIVSCTSLSMDISSHFYFTNYAYIAAAHSIEFDGWIQQLKSSTKVKSGLLGLVLNTTGTVVLSNAVVLGMIAYAENITVNSNSNIKAQPITAFYSDASSFGGCFNLFPAENGTCKLQNFLDYAYAIKIVSNSTIYWTATKSINVLEYSTVLGNAILMCSDSINVYKNATINADGGGCLANTGPGHGGAPHSMVYGGGGGGHGGIGGYGTLVQSPSNGGIANSANISGYVSAGSGGGCAVGEGSNCNSEAAAGGGIISLFGNENIYLDGTVSAAGLAGYNSTSGGGAGGAIVVATGVLSGNGNLIANGGNGGSYSFPTTAIAGGGGGGGEISIYHLSSVNSFNYYGTLFVYGGNGVAYYNTSLSSESGEQGTIIWPNCSAGKGNSLSPPYTICEDCKPGYYKSTYSAGSCSKCDGIPHHAVYTACPGGCTTPDCPYACTAGYATTQCENPFTQFLKLVGGPGGFSGIVIAFFLMIFTPIGYQRYHQHLRREKENSRQLSKANLAFLPDFHAKDDVDTFNMQTSKKSKEPLDKEGIQLSMSSTDSKLRHSDVNPMHEARDGKGARWALQRGDSSSRVFDIEALGI